METVPPFKTSHYEKAWKALLFLCLVYTAVYVYYYPPIHGIEDEAGYINLAYVWTHGTTSPTGTAMPTLYDFEPINGRLASWRSPGRPATLVPFLFLLGGNSIFVSSLIIHLLTTLIAAWILNRIGLSPLWALLVLFHPTLMLYSRTVMSDELGGMFLLLALAAVKFKRRSGFWAGIFIGLAAFARLHAAFAVIFLAATFWFNKKKMDAFWTIVGAGSIGSLILAYNYLMVGGPLLYLHAEFALVNVLDRLVVYVPALLLVFPFQLFAPVFDGTEIRWYSRAIALPIFGLLLFYFWNDDGGGFFGSIVIGQRLLILILPVWLISYAGFIERILRYLKILAHRYRIAVVATACLALVISQVVIFRIHQAHLLGFRKAVDDVAASVPEGSLVVANRGMAKFLGTPAMNVPAVDLLIYHFSDEGFDETKISNARDPWFLVFLRRNEGQEMPPTFERLIRQYKMNKIETTTADLSIYRANPNTK